MPIRSKIAPLIALLSVGCATLIHIPSPPPVPPGVVGHLLSRAAAVADIDSLLAIDERVHAHLYAFVSRDSIRRMRDRLVASLPDSISRVQLWLGLDPIVTAFGDGHTQLGPPSEEIIQAVVRGDMLFPLDVAIDETGVLVVARTADSSRAALRGSRILSINHLPGDSLLNVLAGQMSGETVAERTHYAADGFGGRLWLNGVRAPFVVQTRNAAGFERDDTFPLKARAVPLVRRPVAARAPTTPDTGFRYQRLPDHVGYLDFYSMSPDLSPFRANITQAFARIAADSIRTLIVDLRRNGGGNSLLGDVLLSHLNDRPYRQDSRTEWRMSHEMRSYVKSWLPSSIRWMPLQYLSSQGRRLYAGPDGRTVTLTSPVHPAKRADPFFSGRVCILIGPETYSSATDLATAVKDFHLATLIGEETGGRTNSFGEVYTFELPNSRLIAGVSSAFFVRANGDSTDRRGVLPDIEVRRTAEDVRAGRDPAVDRAKACPDRPAPSAR